MEKILRALLLAMISTGALAEWTGIMGNGSTHIYADLASVNKAGNSAKMMELYDFNTIQELSGAKYLSWKQLSEYDCKKKQIRAITIAFFSGNMGGGTQTYPGGLDFRVPYPWGPVGLIGTASEQLWKTACVNKPAIWTLVVGSKELSTFVDLASLSKTSSRAKMWTLFDYKDAQGPSEDKFLSAKMLSEYDCKKKRVRAISVSTYSGNMGTGKVSSSDSNPEKWEPVRMPALREMACGI